MKHWEERITDEQFKRVSDALVSFRDEATGVEELVQVLGENGINDEEILAIVEVENA